MTGWWSISTEPLAVPSGGVVHGVARLPSSKSVTHRALAIALVADEPVVVERPLVAQDSELFLSALERFGCAVERASGSVTVSRRRAQPIEAEIFCGNAGTFFRFAVALAATLAGRWRIDGTPRLRERPVGPLVEALRALGARIDCEVRDGYAPLVVHGGGLRGGRIRLDAGDSSQYLSALLLAGQRAAGPLEIEVSALASAPYVDLTIDLLLAQGGSVERLDPTRYRTQPSRLRGGVIVVEPDLSAAAYPAAAAALVGGELLLEGVALDSKQGDRRFLELLGRMGAVLSTEERGIRVTHGDLLAIDDDLSDIPDQVPTLAALAPFARGTTRLRNVAHLRLKESDRLTAMTSELRRAGAEVEELADGLVIPGIWAAGALPTAPVVIDPHDDHRIAMAMALVGLRRPNLSIGDAQVVAKSWPEFWSELARWLGESA
jgi:3-phosphoshikimate 1-carboxyvinyltransferase